MQIDWFTFGVQIINFLVLVALLRWFLYKPIISAMKKREEKIAERLHAAEEKRNDAEEQRRHYERKTQEFQQQQEQLLREAKMDATQEKEQLIEDARETVKRKREEWLKELEQEQDDLVSDLRQQIGRLATETARRALDQLANKRLEEEMFGAFGSRIEEMDDEERDQIAERLRSDGSEVFFRSAFEVSDEWRERLQNVIRDTFGNDAEISFDTSRDLICGFELDIGGYTYGWNADEFLKEVERDFKERLNTASREKG